MPSTMHPPTRLLPLVAVLAIACPADPPSGTEEAEACSVGFALEGDRSPTTLEVGTLVDGAFTPLSSNGQIAKRTGGQGFAMITPAFRLPASVADGDELCLLVKISHEPIDTLASEEIAPGNQVTITFVRTDDGFLSDGVVFDVLGDASLPGFHMHLGATVIGETFEATVRLENVVVGESV